ncbi:hypothetical protein PENSUB_9842 [Penicillium subrubescens]|uniref:Allantoate permease n=1 Tax=Penicillium subrubescens TaxID=1316194 RepID=A0A1Q5TCG6_9EURO|nr:hypothetical protein PENSUB_9842 [Penicillium subrubescens]
MGDLQGKEAKSSAHLEQHINTDMEDLKSAQVGDRVDHEVQKYAGMGRVDVDEPTSRRLKKLIDRRVLTIMVATYLVQALDKGTLSFTSIMGILDDTHLHGTQQMIGGLLAYLFSLIGSDKVIKSWQALFITYGCFSVLFGVFVLLFMPDSPMTAKCFSEEDKRLMVERVRDNRTGIQNKTFRKYQAIEALKDPQMWCYCGIQLFTTLPTSGLGTFANIIIKGFHFTTLQTQLLSMVLGAYIIFVLVSSMWLVKKTNQNLIVMAAYCIPSFIGTIVLMTVQNKTTATKAGLLMSYYITLSFWAAQTLTLSMISRNIAGQTKKSTVIAANFIAWATGNAIGPQIFLTRDAPRYFTAFSIHLGCYTLLELVLLYLRFHLKRQNEKKDQLASAEGVESEVAPDFEGFEDLTDRENLRFRYVY